LQLGCFVRDNNIDLNYSVTPTPITISINSTLSQVDIGEYLTRFVITEFGAQVGEGVV